MLDDLELYYSLRSAEYDRIYTKPERQDDLAALRKKIRNAFRGGIVLEVACGTGYWTQYIAEQAERILAVDSSDQMLAMARARSFVNCSVEFQRLDAYNLDDIQCSFSFGFHGFWLSHVPIQDLQKFLVTFHSTLLPGAEVVMIDNRFVPGSSTPISRRDSHGNTYQVRRLREGTEFEVLKNFPRPDALRELLVPVSKRIRITEFDYFWMAQYTMNA